MRFLSLACTCNLLFAASIADFLNLPFWSGNMWCWHSIASDLSLVFGPHFSFLQGIHTLLTNFRFNGWTFLIVPFFNISFTFSFTNSSCSKSTIGWEGIFDWKGFEWNGILYPFTVSKVLESYVVLIQTPTAFFNFPANRMSGELFGKNNLFVNGWTFLDSHRIDFPGFKPMLKKVCCGAVISTISLLVSHCP